MPDLDVLRLAVAMCPVDPDERDESTNRDFAVEVYVNEVEMTVLGAGMGRDPYDLLVPPGRLHVQPQPVTVPIARCGCGDPGCDSTSVVIRRDDSVVHWDWRRHRPMQRRVTFDREQYDAEVRRVESDLSWETPERTAGRLIKAGLSSRSVVGGFTVDHLGNDGRDRTRYLVSLSGVGPYQILVDFPWGSLTPSELADRIVTTLTRAPLTTWTASWSPSTREHTERPVFAPASWPRRRFQWDVE